MISGACSDMSVSQSWKWIIWVENHIFATKWWCQCSQDAQTQSVSVDVSGPALFNQGWGRCSSDVSPKSILRQQAWEVIKWKRLNLLGKGAYSSGTQQVTTATRQWKTICQLIHLPLSAEVCCVPGGLQCLARLRRIAVKIYSTHVWESDASFTSAYWKLCD